MATRFNYVWRCRFYLSLHPYSTASSTGLCPHHHLTFIRTDALTKGGSILLLTYTHRKKSGGKMLWSYNCSVLKCVLLKFCLDEYPWMIQCHVEASSITFQDVCIVRLSVAFFPLFWLKYDSFISIHPSQITPTSGYLEECLGIKYTSTSFTCRLKIAPPTLLFCDL